MDLHHVVVGTGPPILVPHGGPGLHHELYRTLDPLAAAASRQLVYWDHRGHGRSARLPDCPVTMQQFADDAVRLADHLGLDTFTVLGHSFGGWVAQELALKHPERVEALILASTTPGQLGTTESPDDDQGPPPPAEVAELLGRQPGDDEELVEAYTALAPYFFGDAATARPYLDALDPALVSADSMIRVFGALADWSTVDRLGEIACPTLVLGGRHDVFCSPQQAARIARRIPAADTRILDTGHFLWMDDPAAFFTTVTAWLEQVACG